MHVHDSSPISVRAFKLPLTSTSNVTFIFYHLTLCYCLPVILFHSLPLLPFKILLHLHYTVLMDCNSPMSLQSLRPVLIYSIQPRQMILIKGLPNLTRRPSKASPVSIHPWTTTNTSKVTVEVML
ncbi:uncharacterized protein BDW43DRAFT_186045 [Aspergillus alliaceus]|uniref:uncharacterized protein n=1 Tax=Petromyces alliaceus TaxID=209559 RepID=UPI0012A58B46|nr:uncharacterized protein BDW43DRAFT_186045 [Aspergillus alliaceus]KAB8229661.1 hypothetical protein BDW43DRAFT_186045 [Aspergillus alliaceus]